MDTIHHFKTDHVRHEYSELMHGFRDILALSDSEIYGASKNCSLLNFVSHNRSLNTVMVTQF